MTTFLELRRIRFTNVIKFYEVHLYILNQIDPG